MNNIVCVIFFYNLEKKHLQECFVELPKKHQNFNFHFTQKSISILVNRSLSKKKNKKKSTFPLVALLIPPGGVGGNNGF